MRCCRPNSDEELRRLERSAAAGDPQAEIRAAVARERTDGAVERLRDWIVERLTKANGRRLEGLVGDGLVRDAVFRAADMYVHGERGQKPHPGLPRRSWVHGRWENPRDALDEFHRDVLETTYALAVEDEETGSIVLGIRAAPGWQLHGPDRQYLGGPLLQRAWPTWLERALEEERRVVETEENWAGDNDIADDIVASALRAANSQWRAWRRNMVDESPDGIRIPLEIVRRWSLLEQAERPAASNPPRALLRNGEVIPVRVCPKADETHRISKRAYAHVFCGPGSTICVASAFFGLPRSHRDGLLAHEIGHLLAGTEEDEHAADQAFFDATGVRIGYRDGPHGRCLQSLSPVDSRSLVGRFAFEFSGRGTGVETEEDQTRVDYVVSVRCDERSFTPAWLAGAMGMTELPDDAAYMEETDRVDWRVPTMGEAARQAAALREVLPDDMEVLALAIESDPEGTRELGWSA